MLSSMTMRSLIVAALGLTALVSTSAQAATEKMYSYVPADKATAARTDSGLTFVFDKGLMSMKMKLILATQAHAEADVEPADERELGVKLDKILPAGANERALYSVKDKAQGLAMVKAFCPGSSKGWLVFGALRPREGTQVQALGDDPITGKARYCTTLNFEFKGEWKVPEYAVRRTFGDVSPVESRF
jgi:methionine-rich copper-binding protein CopC